MAQDSDGRKPAVSARIPHDTHDQLQQYCDENDISKTDAVRRFIEQGLERSGGPITRAAMGGNLWQVLIAGLLILNTILLVSLV